MSEPISVQYGTSGPQGKGMKRSALGSGGESSRSQRTKDSFGVLAEVSLSTLLVILQQEVKVI